jgi:hypothetical protein
MQNNSKITVDDMSVGLLRTDDGLVIARPGLTSDDFAHSQVGAGAKLSDNRPPYVWYSIPLLQMAHTPCAFALLFIDGVIEQVEFTVLIPETRPFWAAEEKQKNDRWLESLFGKPPPYLFPWGKIFTVLDIKAGSGPIVCKYKK